MTTLSFIGLLLLGIIAGYCSGLVGIGGGVIIVPALILFFGFTQHQAQGTTLALLIPPIGIFAVWNYYEKGYVDIKTAAIICLGFVVGGYLGSRTAVVLSAGLLRRLFAALLVILGIKLFLSQN